MSIEAAKALKVARGVYQRRLICGKQNWSGSDLGGKAKGYGKHYATSRRRLLERLEDAELAHLVKSDHTTGWSSTGAAEALVHRAKCAAGTRWLDGTPSLLEQIADAAACEEEAVRA